MEPDAWLKDCGEYYEHIAVHVDDLLTASKDPQSVIDTLINDHLGRSEHRTMSVEEHRYLSMHIFL